MTTTWQRTLVARDGTIGDAMRALEVGSSGIALAVEADGRLAGVITDGDLRRAMLRGETLQSPIDAVLTKHPVALREGQGRADALDLMRARRIGAIPVLDHDGRPIALHLLHAFLEPVSRANWAIVMAGGQGTRLRPLTDATPKPMLHVAGRPILERIVLHLIGFGITRIFLSVHYLAEVIEAHFGDGSGLGITIEYLREPRALGTGGALGMLPEPPDRPLILLNGDLVTTVDIGRLLDFHTGGRFAATIGTRRYVHTVPFGCIEREGDRVVGLEEKPSMDREVSTGIYALEPRVVARVAPDTRISMPELIASVLSDGEPVGAFEVEEDWVDVGHRDQLVRAREGS